MRRYIRDKTFGGCYFITFVLQDRGSSLLIEKIDEFRSAYQEAKQNHDFTLDAMVVLPDHVHMILTLPDSSDNYSAIVGSLKAYFSKQVPNQEPISSSRHKKRERGIWQRRFWEHRIRDDLDLKRHMDYIHYNPVKHGLVDRPIDWQYSTLHTLIDSGIYPGNWGCESLLDIINIEYD